jgi:hypothetical protein
MTRNEMNQLNRRLTEARCEKQASQGDRGIAISDLRHAIDQIAKNDAAIAKWTVEIADLEPLIERELAADRARASILVAA